MKLEFSQQIFGKSTNIKFHENPSNESRVVLCGPKDRRHEANSRFSQFCNMTAKTNLFHHNNCLTLPCCFEHYGNNN